MDSKAIENFNKLGNTVMLPGIKKEPGVLVMYAAGEKENPRRVSILEVYEDLDAYNNHIETPHYLQYKQEANSLVKSLKFIDVDPILLGSKPQSKPQLSELFFDDLRHSIYLCYRNEHLKISSGMFRFLSGCCGIFCC